MGHRFWRNKTENDYFPYSQNECPQIPEKVGQVEYLNSDN
jgi:hypothetical protein